MLSELVCRRLCGGTCMNLLLMSAVFGLRQVYRSVIPVSSSFLLLNTVNETLTKDHRSSSITATGQTFETDPYLQPFPWSLTYTEACSTNVSVITETHTRVHAAKSRLYLLVVVLFLYLMTFFITRMCSLSQPGMLKTESVSRSVCKPFFSIGTHRRHIGDGCSEAVRVTEAVCHLSLFGRFRKIEAGICRGLSHHAHFSLGLIIRIPGMALLRNTLTDTHTRGCQGTSFVSQCFFPETIDERCQRCQAAQVQICT